MKTVFKKVLKAVTPAVRSLFLAIVARIATVIIIAGFWKIWIAVGQMGLPPPFG